MLTRKLSAVGKSSQRLTNQSAASSIGCYSNEELLGASSVCRHQGQLKWNAGARQGCRHADFWHQGQDRENEIICVAVGFEARDGISWEEA